jgi:hypothetical protein
LTLTSPVRPWPTGFLCIHFVAVGPVPSSSFFSFHHNLVTPAAVAVPHQQGKEGEKAEEWIDGGHLEMMHFLGDTKNCRKNEEKCSFGTNEKSFGQKGKEPK